MQLASISDDLAFEEIISSKEWYNASCFDREGNIFLVVNGSQVRKYSPELELLAVYPVPYSDYKEIDVDTDGSFFLYASTMQGGLIRHFTAR